MNLSDARSSHTLPIYIRAQKRLRCHAYYTFTSFAIRAIAVPKNKKK